MKLNLKNLIKTGAVVFVFCLMWKYVGLFENLIRLIFKASLPLVIGVVIAFIINIPMTAIEKRLFSKSKKPHLVRLRRPLALFFAFITILLIIALVARIVVPELAECIELIINLIPKAIKWIAVKLDEFEIVPENIIDFLGNTDWKSKIDQIVNVVTTGIGSTVQIVFSTVSTLVSGLVTALLSIIFSIYLLSAKRKLRNQFTKLLTVYLPEKITSKIIYVFRVFNCTFRKYVIGQCTEALILGCLCIVGMLILNLPYATMIGTLIAFTALIPIAGAYIGAAVGALMIVTISPAKALIFLIFLIILQQIEGNLIYPKVVGSTIGLPGIWVLAAVTVGGAVAGVSGMLLGVPVTASVYRIIKHDLRKRLSQAVPQKTEVKPEEKPAEEKNKENNE